MVKGHAKNHDSDRRHHRDDQKEHDGDKPRGAAFVLGRGLGDAKGIDKGIRQEKQRAHGDWMILQGQENRLYASGVVALHLIRSAPATLVAGATVE